MQKHCDLFAAIMEPLQNGKRLGKFLLHVVDWPDVERGADFTARPDGAACCPLLARSREQVGAGEDMRKQNSELPAVALRYRRVEVGAV